MKADWNTIKNKLHKLLPNQEALYEFTISQEHTADAIMEVERALQQYDAKSLIVVVTGLLKAGKSTLVNLLAHNANISPVGYGIDTTLRPAMVVSGDSRFSKEGGIEVFMPKKGWLDKINDEENDDDQEDEAIERRRRDREERENKYRRLLMMNVLDYFRLENVKLNPDIDRVPYPDLKINEKVLRNLLCTKPSEENTLLPTEPLLVVIHTPASKDSLLRKDEGSQHGIMLLDMPGLDSGNMAVKTAKLYRELLWESDMVLFLQSSVAPLNEKGKETFKDIIGNRTDMTAWIVHNMMNMKPWLKPSVIETENNKQVDLTKNYLNEILFKTRSVEPQEVNLGLAYDSIFNPNNIDTEWKQKVGQGCDPFTLSRFPLFKEKIRDNVNKRGAEVHDQHCRENLIKAIKNLSSQLELKLKKEQKELKYFKKIEQNLNEVHIKAQREFSFLKDLQEASAKDWGRELLKQKMLNEYEAKHANNLDPHNSKSERKLSEVDKELHKFDANCLSLANDYMRHLDIWDGIWWGREKASDILVSFQEKIFENFKNETDKRYISLTTPSKKFEDIKGWKKLDPGAKHKPFEKREKFWKFFTKEVSGTYNYDDVKNYRDGYIDGYLKQVEIIVTNLHKQLLADLSKTAAESINSTIQQGFKLVKKDIEKTQGMITKLSTYINELKAILLTIL